MGKLILMIYSFMELREANIIKLTQQINNNKIKLQSLKLKMQNEVDDMLYNRYKKEYDDANKLLNKLTIDLNKEKEIDKKEKLAYKKSLTNVKEVLNSFYKDTKSNTKIKRHIEEINAIVWNIEKYLG